MLTVSQSHTDVLLSKLRLLLRACVLCNFHLPLVQMLSILDMFYLHWFCVHVFAIVVQFLEYSLCQCSPHVGCIPLFLKWMAECWAYCKSFINVYCIIIYLYFCNEVYI